MKKIKMDKMKLGIVGVRSRSTTFYINELNKLYNQEKEDIVLVITLLMQSIHFYQTFSDSLDAIVQDYITELEKMDIENL
jgi:aspartate racemase